MDGAFRLAEIEREAVEWLWTDRLARGMLALLEADPGMGKGFVTIDLAARITRGESMPNDDRPVAPENVLLCSSEDSHGAVVRARAEAAGADLSRIYCFDGMPDVKREFAMMAAQDVLNAMEEVLSSEQFGLVIIDPLVDFLQAMDCGASSDVRYLMTCLAQIAARQRCAMILVRHLIKSAGGKAIYRGTGSIAFAAVSRFVYTIGHHPTESGQRVLASVKNNVSAPPPSLAFRIVAANEDAPKVEWIGQTGVTAEELIGRTAEDSAMERARDLLRETLQGGAQPEAVVRSLAESRGLSHRTLERAKAEMCVRSYREGFGEGARWMWGRNSPQE